MDSRFVWFGLVGIDAPEGVQWCHDAKGIDYRCGVMATAWMISAYPRVKYVVTGQKRPVQAFARQVFCRGFQPECGKCECGMVSSLS